MKKRILSIFLSIVMLVSLLPTTALALASHSHCVCGGSVTVGGHTHENITSWVAWDGTDADANTADIQLPGTNVYLSNNVSLNDDIAITGAVNFCLNGYKIESSASVFSLVNGAALSICDCSANKTGELSGVVYLYSSSTVNLYSGTITSTSYGIHSNGNNSIVNVYDGVITAANNGIYNYGKNSVNIYGGTITTTGSSLDAVCNTDGTVTVSGGTINAGNEGICNYTGTVTISAGSISGRYGINNNQGTVTISDVATVSGTTSGILNSKTLIVSGGTVSGGSYGIQNYSVYNNADKMGIVELSGAPVITGTMADIYLVNNKVINISGALTYGAANAISVKMDSAGTFTTGWTAKMGDAAYSSYFTSAMGSYTVQKNNSGELKLAKPPATIPVTGVELSESSLTLDVGDTATLTATVLPDDATDKSVSWESSDPTVAKVENGLVTALKPGSTTITATTTDGSLTDTCEVTVNKIAITGTIAITTTQEPTVGQEFRLDYIVIPDGNYSRTGRAFSPSGSIEAGKDYTLSVGLKPNDGYYFADGVAATINGKAATVVRSGDNISIQYTYSFASPAADSVDILLSGISADTAPVVLPGIEQADVVLPFTAKVLDQYDQTMAGQTIEWSITGTNTTGISVNNGTVTVTEDASEGNYTLTATCDGKSDSIAIKVEKAESVLTTVKIFDGGGSGKEITTVDRTIPDVGYTLYINSVAKGYDQYGKVMTGLTFTWSNTNTDSEISLINGYVTIKSGAKEDSFSYTASCNGKSATVTVNLTKKMFTVTYTDNVANETVFSDVQLSVQSGGNAPAYPDGTPSRTGYIFDGWYTSTDGGATLSASAYNFETPMTGNLTLYAKWTEKATVSINDAVQTYTWNGSGKSFEITDTPNTGFTVQYKVNDNWTTTAPSAVGTYDVKITRVEDDTYKAYEKIITSGLVINAAAPNYAAPTAKTGLKYTGQPQELIAAAEVTGGTMYYALGGRYNPTGDWSTNVPTGTDAKTYYVWYKIEGDPGYTDVGQACVSVTIAKAPAATTPDSSSYTVNYAAENITFDSTTYEVSTKSDGSGTTIASGDIADYVGQTIFIRTKGDDNHESSEWVSISIAARPAAPTGIVVTNETAAGQGNGSVTGITAEMEYKVGTGDWTTSTGADLTGLAAGAQITVRVKATADAPHGVESIYTVSAGDTLTVTFDAQNGSVVTPVTGLSYNATITELPETTRPGYTFGGWWTAVNGGGSQLSVSTQITGNITYYAKWTPVALTGAVNISGTLQVGQTLTATVSGDNNTGALSYQWYRGEEAISEATGSTYTLVAADAGKTIKCVVSSSIQTGTVTSAATAAIAKLNAPAAPTGLAAAAPSAPAANDGKITGVTGDMEYSTDGTNWTACTDTEITGLGSGTYYVRIKETASTSAGASATVVVPAVYTVTFEANGGDPDWELVGVVFEQSVNEAFAAKNPGSEYTAAQIFIAVRSGYDFAGWYTGVEGGEQFDFNEPVTGNITLYARWSSEPVYDITGEVDQAQENGEPTPANGVEVTLCQGNTVLFTKITDASGKYDFHAPAGSYNIVAEKEGKTMTQLVNVTDHNEQVGEIILPYQNVSSELTIPDGTPDIVVGGLDEEVVESNPNATSNETHITLSMTVEQKEDVTSSEAPEYAELKAEQEEIKTKAGGQKENLTFLKIDLTKVITGDGAGSEPVTTTTNLLKIIIPFETSGRQAFKVYRYHGSDVDVLTTTTNADGEYIEISTGSIIIHAKKFSTYAIGYTVPASSGGYTPTYAITVEKAEHGTIKANRTYASYGSTVTITTEPEDGYVLSGLTVTDSQGNKIEATDKGDGTYTFKMPRRKVTVTAVFTMSGSYSICPGDSSCPIYPFTDADPSAWYHDGVHYCIDNGLMAGYGNGIFKPNADTTRAMITVMLWRLNGSPVVNYLLDFKDVEEGQWYTEAIRWAKSEGVAEGYGNGYFGTNDAITREQIVTILWRYAQYKGYDVSVGEDTNILSYDDAFDVAEYAIPAMQWACGSGMVQGMNDPDGEGMILAPESKGTRAQIATMIMRFCEEILK